MDRTDHPPTAIEALAARVDAIQATCDRLARENAQLRASAAVPAGAGGRPISRAGLLKAAAAGAVVTTLGSELAGAPAALADGVDGATEFSTTQSVAVTVKCSAPDGTGVEAVGPGNSEATDYWGVYSSVTNGIGMLGISLFGPALKGESSSTASNATAIIGILTSSTPGSFSSAVRGQNNGTEGLGIGVWGSQAGVGWGGYFTSDGGIGVNASGGNGTGVNASGATGVVATGSTVGVSASGGTGVNASGATGVSASGTNVGVNANAPIAIEAAGTTAGVQATASSGYGVVGEVGTAPALPSAQAGVAGHATGFPGVVGASDSTMGVFGESASGSGVRGNSGTGPGLTGHSNGGYGLSAAGGKAQLYLVPASSAGAPRSGSHSLGEVFLDKAGSLFVCVAAGTPGTWKQINVS